MSIVKKFIPHLFIIILLATGCKNKYEKKIIGNYKATSAITNSEIVNQLKLSLKENMRFQLTGKNINLVGKWEADDNGDWTWLKLSFNEFKSECIISGKEYEFITIINPNDIDSSFKNVSKIIFLRL